MLAIATLFVIGLISCSAKLWILECDRVYKFIIILTYIYITVAVEFVDLV